MKQMMLLALEESLIKLQNQWVLIGFLDDHGIVCIVQTSCSGCLGSVTGSGRLTSTP